MLLTVELNAGAHGNIHELLGGSWSRESVEYANNTSPIVLPFVHDGVVSAGIVTIQSAGTAMLMVLL